jgi:hypothetical protein
METLTSRSPGGGHGLRNLAEFSRDPRRRTTYRDLLDRPMVVSLAMLMNEGPPQVQPVWCNFDGTHIPDQHGKGPSEIPQHVAPAFSDDPGDRS